MKNFEKRINLPLNEKITITYGTNSIDLTGPGTLNLSWNQEEPNIFDQLTKEAEPK